MASSFSRPEKLEEKLAQLLMVRIGSNLPPVKTAEQDEARVTRLLQECPVGGLVLFNGGSQTGSTLARLQSLSPVPLLIGADIERGVGQQVRDYTLFPHAMTFGELPNGQRLPAIRSFAEILAEEARDVGIHITFGPVADVNTNSRNPIISTRAFSEDPLNTAEMVAVYVSIVESNGLLATAKHFPGHGDADEDSHDASPVVERSLEELQQCELVPFQAAIDARCGLIMSAHVAYPALDPSGTPATLSPTILKHLLREEMGFGGAVCSDSLLMAGVRRRFDSEGEMARAVLDAGVDVLLDVEDPASVVKYLAKCVATNRLSESRVDEALQRVWALKKFAFEPQESEKTPENLPASRPSDNSHRKALAARVATRSIRVLASDDDAPRFRADSPLTAILLKPFATPIDPPEQPLAAELRKRFDTVHYRQIGPSADPSSYAEALELGANAEQLLVAIIVRPAAWHQFGLQHEQHEFVSELTHKRPLVLASLGVPYVLHDFPRAAVKICAYSDVPVSQEALAAFLSGETA